MLEKIKKYFSCGYCHGTGVRKEKEIIPRSELSPMELADIMVNGGYAYKLVEVPCLHESRLGVDTATKVR
jgi:hypothetical protein